MSNANRDKMIRWIRKQLGASGTLVRMVLRHASGPKTAAVCEFEVDSKTTAEDYASSIMMAATDDANGLGGIHKYSLASYYVERPEAPRERFSFRIIAEQNDEDGMDDLATEDASGKGITSQLMRHNEAIMRVSTMGTNDLIRHYQAMLAAQMARNGELEERYNTMVGMAEELASLKHERDLATLRATHDMKQKDQMVEKGMLLLPTLINKMTGKKLLPENTSAEKEALLQFGKSLSPEQLEKMSQVLSPVQFITVIELLKSVMGEDKKEDGKAASA